MPKQGLLHTGKGSRRSMQSVRRVCGGVVHEPPTHSVTASWRGVQCSLVLHIGDVSVMVCAICPQYMAHFTSLVVSSCGTRGPRGPKDLWTSGPFGPEDLWTSGQFGPEDLRTNGPFGPENLRTSGPFGPEDLSDQLLIDCNSPSGFLFLFFSINLKC